MSAQLAPAVGDIEGNMSKIAKAIDDAAAGSCDIVLCPELFLPGYPAQDLVMRPEVISDCWSALVSVAGFTRPDGPGCVVGFPHAVDGRLFNAVALIADGAVQAICHKHKLPNYGVFDEKRWFAAGPLPEPVMFRGRRLGLPICEDVWVGDVLEALAEQGAQIFLSASASPWETGKSARRIREICARIGACGVPCVMVNRAGAQDELVFDGASLALDAGGDVVEQLAWFGADTGISIWQGQDRLTPYRRSDVRAMPVMSEAEEVYTAVMTGLREYVCSSGFSQVLLGLSGGVDSALVAALCADALGPERVTSLMMPFDYTSAVSIRDARVCADALGIAHRVVPIDDAVAALTPLAGAHEGLARQNIQSRIRGAILMTRANATGAMVIATGNKSELAVGYCTLYGDMCGGFAPLGDVYKSRVWELARWRNVCGPTGGLAPCGIEVIPASIIERPPSAELSRGQVDEDSLPPYSVLDRVLRAMVEDRMSIAEASRITGAPVSMVREVAGMVVRSEHKRRQSAPCVRVTGADFSGGRRYPIVNAWPGAV